MPNPQHYNLHVVILAAGQGKRMGHSGPKVLTPLAGRPLIAHVLNEAMKLNPTALHVVVGHGAESVKAACADFDCIFPIQQQQLGTGHAAAQAIPGIPDDATVLVLLGDAPMVQASTLRGMLEPALTGPVILTACAADPTGYGRIKRQGEEVLAIVEQRDASAAELALTEVNSGVLAAPAGSLRQWLAALGNKNSQGEYYLTDVVGLARESGQSTAAVQAPSEDEILGANDRWQLAQLERLYQLREARRLTEQGAIVMDPARLDVRGRVTIDGSATIDVNVILQGEVHLGNGTSIGANCIISDSNLGPGTRVHPMSVLEGAVTMGDCDIGPFARLRPGTRLANATRIGNFVETKNIELGEGSKANHLTYLGDAKIGADVNVGAGTITCNYDGAYKHQTVIGERAFIGSGTQLVAPVEVGAGATIGAGSTITRKVPAEKLTVSRTRPITIDGWVRPKKEKS